MSDAPISLTLQHLLDSSSPGGASVLTSVCQLAPAAGWHATVAPPRYIDSRNEPTYLFAPRAIDGQAVQTVLLDSKGSQANRREAAVADAMKDSTHPAHEALARVPRVVLRFPGTSEGDGPVTYFDLELPHRWADGHVRAGTHEGQSVTAAPQYRAMRDSTPGNVGPIFEMSPLSLVDGVWDSSRKSNQVRLRSAMVGEIFGVLADQESAEPVIPRKGGARVDPIAASVQLDGKTILAVADRQRDELSSGTYDKIARGAKDAAKKQNSGAVLGLGAVPPSLTGLGGIACTQITRSTVLSFATLRQLRFGGSREQDVAFRAVLAAVALLSMSLADDELYLRADCDLVEAAPCEVVLDGRYGVRTALSPIETNHAVQLVLDAYANAEKHGLDWAGQEFVVDGDATMLASAVEDTADEAE
jgi:CRISPR-associated protein Csb1